MVEAVAMAEMRALEGSGAMEGQGVEAEVGFRESLLRAEAEVMELKAQEAVPVAMVVTAGQAELEPWRGQEVQLRAERSITP